MNATQKTLLRNEIKLQLSKAKITIDNLKQIKKNEVKPATDYLFNNSFTNNAKNLENTIAKLDKMSQLGFIPRNT